MRAPSVAPDVASTARRVGACEASGQRFCRNCLIVCAECGGTVGPGYYERSAWTGAPSLHDGACSDCSKLRPEDARHRELRAMRRGVLPDVRAALRRMRRPLLQRADTSASRVAAMSSAPITRHTARPAAKLICAVCSETCGVCEQPYCNTHSLRCRHCGQQYCGNCIGISGLCATCESLATDDAAAVDVNMSEEPCAADLEVSAMARHYRWKRASNSRYVIYEGRNPLMGGVVVVAEVRRGASNVVAVRRFSLIELVRNRLFGSQRR